MHEGLQDLFLPGMDMADQYYPSSSAWSPLRHSVFRALWIAAIISNVGTWMQNVGGVWLMTSLTTSSLMVALMQTATSLPVFLIVLPAGAAADIVNRRRMLLVTQGWMCAAAAGLSGLTLLGATTPWLLLLFTFALGLGAAANMPVWQAVVPGLVSRDELPSAIALNGIAFNIARALGPALAGIIVAIAGPGPVFLLNAASFSGVIAVLYRWNFTPAERSLPPEHVIEAIRTGTRYTIHAAELRAVLVRCSIFILSASALWALMPVVARYKLGMDAIGFGWFFGCIGAGALIGAAILPSLRHKFTTNALISSATVALAIVLLILGYVRNIGLLYGAMILAGAGWMAAMSSFTVAAQIAVPSWVQARALGFYVLSFQGGMAIASVLWGTIAQHFGSAPALTCAALGLLGSVITARIWPMRPGPGADLTPSLHWPEPTVTAPQDPEEGPVLIMLEYTIDPANASRFVPAMYRLGNIRRRDGARHWGLFRDLAVSGRYVETFILDSWAEHLRQHTRMTVADRAIEDQVKRFHIGDSPPTASHFIYEYNRGK
jgi:MFS family permease